MKLKKVLFDIIHPSNVHYFKGLIVQLKESGYSVIITARNKDITHKLLDNLGFSYISMGRMGKSVLQKVIFLIRGEFRAVRILLLHRPDMVFSVGSVNFSHASFILRIPFFSFDDTEHATSNRRLYAPFATRIFSPYCYKLDLGKKHFKFHAFMELFYLHPNQADKWLKNIENPVFNDRRFAIVRLIAWEAFHDIGIQSKTLNKAELIERLSQVMDVYVSVEGKVPPEFERYCLTIPVELIHSYLGKAQMYVGEGATTASECAMLGTPAIYINPLNAGTLVEQERAGLLWNFGTKDDVINEVLKLSEDVGLKRTTLEKRSEFISKQIDPTSFFYWYITNYPESDSIIMNDSNIQYQFK